MNVPFVTKADIEHRVSANVLRQCCDDNDNGVADTSVVDALIRDACSKVLSYCDHLELPTKPPYPPELRRLALDVAEAMLALRHPEYVKRNGRKLMDAVEADLMKVKLGKTSLGTPAAPIASANDGAYLSSATGKAPDLIFRKMGDF